MILDFLSEEIVDAGGRLISERDLISEWSWITGVGPNVKFESLLPSEEALRGAGGDKTQKIIEQNYGRYQFDNMAWSLNQSFFNKAVSYGGGDPAGTLLEFIPDIGNMAFGRVSDLVDDVNFSLPNPMKEVASHMEDAVGGLTAIANITPILGAVVNTGFMVAQAIFLERRRRTEQLNEADDNFYHTRQPAPKFTREGDEASMEMVLDAMSGDDWTGLFLPGYDPHKNWVGKMYEMGFGFAPGHKASGQQNAEATFDVNYYKGRVCLGMIPGTQQITDILQSVLTPDMVKSYSGYSGKVDTIWEWAQINAPTVVGKNAIDTGDFFPSAAQTLSFMWGHIQMQKNSGNPDLYKVNCPYIDGQWRSYCDGAWDYVVEMCNWSKYNFSDMNDHSMNWWIKKGKASQARREMLEANHACAIGCLLGSYRCTSGSLCNVGLNSFNDQNGVQNSSNPCRLNLYDAQIGETVRELHRMQFDMLSASLVCAYVRSSYAAFHPVTGNDGGQADNLRGKLTAMRNKLLNRPDQWKFIVEENVPRDEMHEGQNWYNLLDSVGAFDFKPGLGKATPGNGASSSEYGQGGFALESGQGFEEPAPPVIQLVGRIPGQELATKHSMRRSSGGGGGGLLIGGAALALGYMLIKK